MQPLALLLGDPARLAFPGHLRLAVDSTGGASLAVAARVGAGHELEQAWHAARSLEQAIRQALQDPGATDRHVLLHTLWAAVADLPADALGPDGGADLSLLVAASDAQGVGVSGVGLTAVWVRTAAGLAPLVEAGHPLLSPAGRPASPPGVLTLDEDLGPHAVIGCPSHLGTLDAPVLAEVDRRCGVRL